MTGFCMKRSAGLKLVNMLNVFKVNNKDIGTLLTYLCAGFSDLILSMFMLHTSGVRLRKPIFFDYV